jgi:hypothetical protein
MARYLVKYRDNFTFKCGNVQIFGKDTNKNFIPEKIKGRLNLGNVPYHSVPSLYSYHFLFKILKYKIYNTVILFAIVGIKIGLSH